MTTAIFPHSNSVDIKSVNNKFIWQSANGEDTTPKKMIRHECLDFILSHHNNLPGRYFGLAGINWTFERMLWAKRPTQFDYVSVERSWPVLVSSVPNMPGRRRRMCSIEMNNKTHYGYESEDAKIWCTTTSEMMLGPKKNNGWKRPSKEQRRSFRKNSTAWTAVWLDYSSQLCDEISFSLRRLAQRIDAFAPVVPAIISYMVGRESHQYTEAINAFGSRERLVSVGLNLSRVNRDGFQRAFKTVKTSRYIGIGGVSMEVVMGIFVYQKNILPNLVKESLNG